MIVRQVIRDETVLAGLREGPQFVIARVASAMVARAQRIAVAAKLLAPKVFSTLANSIIVEKVTELHFRVRAGVNYSGAVEDGTGPAIGNKSYMPNPYHLMAYVKARAGIRWASRRRTRIDQMREVRDRAWALAMWIRQHGTQPHPYMKPALEQHREAFYSDVKVAALVGARDAFAARLAELRGARA